MKSQVGYLDVVIPPDIVDYQTSHDMTVQEGQNVTLTCTAAGLPDPTIDWRREEKKPLFSIGTKKGESNSSHSIHYYLFQVIYFRL